MLEERDEEIKELLGPEGTEYTDAQRAELKEIINGVIDFEAMAREALDDTFNTISEEEWNEFVDLFSTIVRDQSLNKLDIYRAKVTYNSIDVSTASSYHRQFQRIINQKGFDSLMNSLRKRAERAE
jgi:phospholipid transport system substrate-binding protein